MKHILSFLEKVEKEKYIFPIFIKKIRIEADRLGKDESKDAGESVKKGTVWYKMRPNLSCGDSNFIS